MPERLPPSRFLVLSVAAHAAAFGVLGYFLVTPSGTEPLSRVETSLSLPPALEEEAPPLERTADAVLPVAREPVAGPEVVEAFPADEGDPRLAPDEGGIPAATAAPGAPGLVGIGGGGLRLRPRRVAVACSPMPAEEVAEAAPVEAAPAVPDVRARPAAGACAAPEYPARERRLGVEGVVEVLVRVDADGAVASAEVASPSGVEAFDAAALAAVRRWRFEPAVTAGVAVPDSVLQKVRFRLVSAAISGR